MICCVCQNFPCACPVPRMMLDALDATVEGVAREATASLIGALFNTGTPGDLCRAGVCRGFLVGKYFDVVWNLASATDMARRWECEP